MIKDLKIMKSNNINTMKRGSRSVVSTTLATAYIEHSFSIHSAYIGSRWQTGGKLLRLAAMICLLLTFGVGNAWGTDATLTQSEITTNITNTTCAYGTPKTYNDTGDGVIWKASCYTDAASRKWMQLKKDANVYIRITTPSGTKITGVEVTLTSASNSSGGVNDISKHTAYSGRVILATDSGAVTATSTGVAYTETISSNKATLSPSGNNNVLYVKTAVGARIWGISVTYVTAASCTTNATVTAGSNSSVTKNSARVTCSSGISSLGSAGCSITSYGFVLGTSSNPTTSNTTYEVGTSYTSTGVSFYKDITGLSSGTTYYVRPYATNGNGTAYGTQTTFTTLFEASITLDKNGGSANGSAKAVENATSLSSISAPTRTGYTVEGYYTTSACTTKIATSAGAFQPSITVSSNTWTNGSSQWKRNNNETFYAKWTANTYSVRFNKNNNDATGSMSNESFTYGESKALTSCAFSLTGYTFAGWATSSGGSVVHADGATVSNLSSTNEAVVDLYAKWTVNNYTVTWKVNNTNYTTGSPSDNVNHGSRVTKLPTDPDPDDYCGQKFVGWTDATDGAYVHGTSTLFTTAGTAPVASGAQIFYAVFADYDD